MMLDPKSYIERLEDSGLEELFNERDDLIEYMRKYERHELDEGSFMCCPDPETIYFVYVKYLSEISDLIVRKMVEEDFHEKYITISLCETIDREITSLGEKEAEQFLEMLENDDKKLYDEYVKYKKTSEEDDNYG